ncbi:MAG: DUF3109 family protein [Flavobacteriia bacterium]|nr:DUF3109 family protein [Flavobacteriia bacterium]
MLEVKDKVVSTDIFKRKFVCDLNACKGACCIEGDAGAPLTFEEVDILEEVYDLVKPYMRPEGIAEVEKKGVFYIDEDNEPVTALVNGGECAFVYFDEQGITKCAIEKAYLNNEIDFKKPISCHLYPIREMRLNELTALNYNEIIRAYGEDFFRELETVSEEIKNFDF